MIWLNEVIDDPKKDKLYVVTEWLTNGSLGELLEKKNEGKATKGGLPVTQAREYLKDMLKALHYCHNVAKVFHRDIKPENIMLNHNKEAILIDFGVSALKGDDDFIHTKMGTLLYFAPEMFQSGKNFRVQGAKTDLWALGVTFFYLLSGKYPHEAGNFYDLKAKISNEEIDFDHIYHEPAKNFLKKVLVKDPD